MLLHCEKMNSQIPKRTWVPKIGLWHCLGTWIQNWVPKNSKYSKLSNSEGTWNLLQVPFLHVSIPHLSFRHVTLKKDLDRLVRRGAFSLGGTLPVLPVEEQPHFHHSGLTQRSSGRACRYSTTVARLLEPCCTDIAVWSSHSPLGQLGSKRSQQDWSHAWGKPLHVRLLDLNCYPFRLLPLPVS